VGVTTKIAGSRQRFLLHTALYGAAIAVLALLLKWLQWRFVILNDSTELYAGLIALIFTFLGIWLSKQLSRQKENNGRAVAESPSDSLPETEDPVLQLLSRREREVLELLIKGHSNAEIAAGLFLSLSTVKTHVSNLFVKMDVKSRAQAIARASELRIKG
jgi:two-component system, NarL family, response regulator LiaR